MVLMKLGKKTTYIITYERQKYILQFILYKYIYIHIPKSKNYLPPDPLLPDALSARICRSNLMATIVLDSDLIPKKSKE